MSKKLKHPVITVSVTVRCRADDKREVLDSLNEWYFGKYAPSMWATGRPKVTKQREATKAEAEFFWDLADEEDQNGR